MSDRRFFLTLQAIRRQLTAMPNELYLIRLIHHQTRKAFAGERLWTATQLVSAAVVRFLRARNREGCDVYVQPYVEDQNAGYILVDLDQAESTVIENMRIHGHDPCVVLQTSPGHLQAWIRLSTAPLEPAVATAAGKQLARAYGGDLASTDWRHLGRLAGFTNQKPARRTRGHAPWVKIVHASVAVAPQADALLQSIRALPPVLPVQQTDATFRDSATSRGDETPPSSITAAEATHIYHGCMQQWHIRQRFPQPDWSIVDLWVARFLLAQGTPALRVQAIIRLASPQFPRRHGDPDDYLCRTIARATAFPFPRARGAVCTSHAGTPVMLEPPLRR